jgi:REP element-mobilizing transposase RayT
VVGTPRRRRPLAFQSSSPDGTACRPYLEESSTIAYGYCVSDSLPTRKVLPHTVPAWVRDGAIFFVTINAQDRSGSPLLQNNRPALLWDSIRWRMNQGQCWPHIFLIMPDHLHLLASFSIAPGMPHVIRNWKHWTSESLGIQWQRGFFDHRIRNIAEYEEKAAYIRLNPVRKALVATTTDWPHAWEMPAPIW